MKFGILWQSVSTWMVKPPRMPSSWQRDHPVEQDLPVALRAKLSSVMKNRSMPCALFARMIFSRSSGVRKRLLRPCTLMMVQNEHW